MLFSVLVAATFGDHTTALYPFSGLQNQTFKRHLTLGLPKTDMVVVVFFVGVRPPLTFLPRTNVPPEYRSDSSSTAYNISFRDWVV